MPEVTYTAATRLPLDAVWAFVSDMNNWAPFLTGYQRHAVLDETDSLWTLKGDVGILGRTVELRAHVTAWEAPEKVSFQLTGVDEAVDGGGTLALRRRDAALASVAPRAPRSSWWRRFVRALASFFFRRAPVAAPAPRGEAVELEFTLRMDAMGPAGPLVNAMLGPALEVAVADLAGKIVAHLEAGARPGGGPDERAIAAVRRDRTRA